MYECEKCSKTFKYLRDFERHKNRKYPCGVDKLTCCYCKKRYSSAEGLSRHRKKCKSKYDNKNITISISNPTIIRNNTLKSGYVCEYCNAEFSHKSSYYRHKKDRCKVKKNNIPSFMEELRKQLDIEESSSNSTYNINSYGNEDMGHIRNDFGNLLRRMHSLEDFGEFIKFGFQQIHCNPNRIENHNVAIKSKTDYFRKGMMNVYSNEGWKYKENKEVINDSTKKFIDIIEEVVTQNYSDETKIPRDVMRYISHVMNFIREYDNIDPVVEENKSLEEVKKGVFMMIDNFQVNSLEKKDD
jgi:hypothetical protein